MALRSRDDAAELRKLARSLHFSNEVIDSFLESAAAAEARCVSGLMTAELEARERNKRARLHRRARFPQVKSLEGYDFSQVAFPDGYGEADLRSPGFVDEAQDFVFHGQTGRGKTHLAIAAGSACVAAGRAACFFATAELALALPRASRDHSLEQPMGDIAKCDLLMLDEFGYAPIGVEGSRLLFQVVADCCERRSVIFATNIEFGKWGTVLGDDRLAAALIDRVVHHGRLVGFGGASRRMEGALMLGKGGAGAARGPVRPGRAQRARRRGLARFGR